MTGSGPDPLVAAVGPDDLESYWRAVTAADPDAAYAVARRLRTAGAPLDSVLSGLVVASQARVGGLWARNQWTVAHEHAATAVNEEVVRRLGADQPEPTDGPPLLVACVEREWHALPALVVTHTLRSWGMRATFLGVNSSRDQLVSRILDTGPRAVLLSASLASSLSRVRRQVEAIRGTGTPVVVGGAAFDAAGVRASALGATAYAAGPAEAAELLVTIPRHVSQAPPLRHAEADEARVLVASGEEIVRAAIAATTTALGRGDDPSPASPDTWWSVLTGFAPHVVDCVAGALLTGDPSVVDETRTWYAEVLAGRDADPRALPALWSAFAHEVRDIPRAAALLARG
ncbi:cobalamin B12-binding domain-containing protein [Nocardioides ferulae]|uniref:cobalamin B12-binding domain-containing protein n=1 Tax=Nocardioides ferulae TaxID=2340821 RepID=UPI000EAB6B21|nr:cobalamin-dependent protein [Nocardioides ferulae]